MKLTSLIHGSTSSQSNLLPFRGFSQLWVNHIHHLHPQGAFWAEQEPQCPAFAQVRRYDAEGRKHLPELQNQPASCFAALHQLFQRGISGPAHQRTWWFFILSFSLWPLILILPHFSQELTSPSPSWITPPSPVCVRVRANSRCRYY